MLEELDFSRESISRKLLEWKSKEQIWGDITRAMRRELKSRLEDIL